MLGRQYPSMPLMPVGNHSISQPLQAQIPQPHEYDILPDSAAQEKEQRRNRNNEEESQVPTRNPDLLILYFLFCIYFHIFISSHASCT